VVANLPLLLFVFIIQYLRDLLEDMLPLLLPGGLTYIEVNTESLEILLLILEHGYLDQKTL